MEKIHETEMEEQQDRLLELGGITVDQYVELSSPNAVPFRDRFRQMRQAAVPAAAL